MQCDSIVVAASGQEAIEIAQAHRPNLILLDLTMPGLCGAEVLSALKGNPATVPILVLVVYVGSGWERDGVCCTIAAYSQRRRVGG